jgi:hypothetical protein
VIYLKLPDFDTAGSKNVADTEDNKQMLILIVNNNTFCFATIDKVLLLFTINITSNRMQNPIIKMLIQ